MSLVVGAYKECLRQDSVSPDTAQAEAIQTFARLEQELTTTVKSNQSVFSLRWFVTGVKRWFKARTSVSLPQGVYLHGPAGRGKTMVMDLFFQTLPIERKRRVHFHVFMLEIHERIHKARISHKNQDVLQDVADQIAAQAKVLCFDEFLVTNIADAMILGRLYQALQERGVIWCMTSNFAPDDLYKDGLQRDRFLPFVDMIKNTMVVLCLATDRDYRLLERNEDELYFHPMTAGVEQHLLDIFARLTQNAPAQSHSLKVGSRDLYVPKAAGKVAFFYFHDLCSRALAVADYQKIAQTYSTIIIAAIPRMGPDRHNEARRFITLIDILYEAHTKVIIGADTQAKELYISGDGAFEFRRTVSRLAEMRSADWGNK